MGTSKRLLYLLLIFLFIYLQFFHRLGALGLVGPDEPRYARIAREMLLSGDYVTPRLLGQAWFEKPVLYYWLTAFSYRLFGVNEFAARLASALAATLGIGIVFQIGRNWISLRGGVHAALILSTSVLYFSLARAASMDMLLTGTLSASWACLYFALFRKKSEKPAQGFFPKGNSSSAFHLSYFFLALSVLAKGPVGLVLWGGTVAIFLLATRQTAVLSKMKLGVGVLIFAATALPWYWLCYQANGYHFIDEFLLRHNLGRFATDRYQHSQPFSFYLGVMFVGFFPWIFQIISPARRFLESKFRVTTESEAKEMYLWLWVLLPLLFFSFSKSKLPGYILPIAPSMALLVAREFELFLTGGMDSHQRKWFRRMSFLQALFICLLGVSLPFIKGQFNIQLSPFVPHLTALLIGIGGLGMIFLYRNEVRWLLNSYLLGTAVMVIFITHLIFPQIDPLESTRQLSAFLKQEERFENQPVFLVGLPRRIEYGLNFYLNTTTHTLYSEDDLRTSAGEILLITLSSFEPKSLLARYQVKSQTIFDRQKIWKLTPQS